MTSDTIRELLIQYPNSKHPITDCDFNFKQQYFDIINYIYEKYFKSLTTVKARLERYKRILFRNDSEKVSQTIPTKVKFSLNEFNKYKYVLIYDILFLFDIEKTGDYEKFIEYICENINAIDSQDLIQFANELFEGKLSRDYDNVSKLMLNKFNTLRNYLSKQNTKISFVATMSAGKSALINSIVGSEVALSQKAACTANIAKYYSRPLKESKFQLLGNKHYYSDISSDRVLELGSHQLTPFHVLGYFSSVLAGEHCYLVDTPGANSSMNDDHKKVAYEQLSKTSTDILVYVFPVGHYATDEDLDYLNFIKNNAKHKKIIFVVSQVDTCTEDIDDISNIIENLKSFLESKGFNSPIICPVCAKGFLLMNRYMRGEELSKEEMRNFKRVVEDFQDEYYNLNNYYDSEFSTNNDSFVNLNNFDIFSNEEFIKAYVNTGVIAFQKTLLKIIKEI